MFQNYDLIFFKKNPIVILLFINEKGFFFKVNRRSCFFFLSFFFFFKQNSRLPARTDFNFRTLEVKDNWNKITKHFSFILRKIQHVNTFFFKYALQTLKRNKSNNY